MYLFRNQTMSKLNWQLKFVVVPLLSDHGVRVK